jgi:hypothetical protein
VCLVLRAVANEHVASQIAARSAEESQTRSGSDVTLED